MERFLELIQKENAYRFVQATSIITNLTDILKNKYSSTKIVLIGSCLDSERFHSHSDIDICVEGIPKELFFQVYGELMMESSEFDLDLIPIEDASDNMKKSINNGVKLYEK